MDKFVKGENEMWKMPAKKHIQTRIVSASAVKRAGLTFRLPRRPLEDVQAKKKLLRSNHPYYRNVAKHLWREPQIIKLENSFHVSLVKIQCHVSRFCVHLTDCNLQSQLRCAVIHFEQNFTKLVPDSIRCFIIGE